MSDRPGEMDERDVDQRFASIVARWDSPLPDRGAADDDAEDGTGDAPEATSSAPDGTGDAPAPADRGDDDHDAGRPEPAGRPPWVNPSPLDIVIPASSWRVSPPPTAGTGPSATPPPAADDSDDHFEPPPVTLPPQEDLHFWGAVVGLVGGPLLLLYVALARPFHSDRWFAAGVVLSLVGFALLVLRQPRHRDPGDTDDGARV